ncbi:MAG: hypothetical protein JO137_00785, partial [Hyphomicrobiales bacterium]|nr:hypothetical protein [Hyphomicrobiales bacterium]
EAQKFDPGQCQSEDEGCVRSWYAEYSAGLIAEFKYYARNEDFLAEMLADPQETLLTAKLSLILIEGGTKYSQWAVLGDEEAARKAGLDLPHYEAITGVCRDAVSNMRAALFDLRQHRDKAHQEAGAYLKNAMSCEKTFGLSPVVSKLRGHDARERQIVPPAAPLRITPGASVPRRPRKPTKVLPGRAGMQPRARFATLTPGAAHVATVDTFFRRLARKESLSTCASF